MILAPRIRTVLLGVALLSMSGRAAADTIVLKNGRRIIALNAVEEGDKVKYLTSAGELSLPKSIVDHIEKGGAVPMAGSPGADAANLAIAPPAAQPIGGGDSDAIERAAVHGGAIDRPYIAKLEGEARAGTKQANFNAAMGHHAAASFEISHGDMEHALADERTALIYAPEEPALLMNVAYVHLRRSEYKQSLEYLERARRAGQGATRQEGRGELQGKREQPFYIALQRSSRAGPGARCFAHAGNALFRHRIRTELFAAGFHRHHLVHARSICRHNQGSRMGGRAE